MSYKQNTTNKSESKTPSGTIFKKAMEIHENTPPHHKKDVTEQVARHEMIAEAAYYSAERCGFNSGDEIQDWLEAEAEIDKTL